MDETPRDWMEGTNLAQIENIAHAMNLDNSCDNIAELMNFDAYSLLYDNPYNLVDQMNPSFVLSPLGSTCASVSPFNRLNFSPYDLGIPLVNGDIAGGSSYGREQLVFPPGGNQLPFTTSSTNHGVSLMRTRDETQCQQCTVGDVGKTAIPRCPMEQSLAERMLKSMYLLKESFIDGILAQIWVPVKSGNEFLLSTREQPYLSDHQLSGYREVSKLFTFSIEPKSESFLGLPGRVFTSRFQSGPQM